MESPDQKEDRDAKKNIEKVHWYIKFDPRNVLKVGELEKDS